MTTLVRPYGAFTGIECGVQRLLAETGLDAIDPETYAIYGSAVRALWTRESAADVNVALLGRASASEIASLLARVPRVRVADRAYRDCDAIIQDADFTVCQAVLHNGNVHFDECFFEHVARRVLLVNRVRRRGGLASLLRAFKYAQRGWGLPYVTVVDITERLPRSIRMPPAAELQRHSGGTIQ
jgi:hypothetical protein